MNVNLEGPGKSRRARGLAFAALAVFLGGCMVGPNYHRPEVSVPAAYPQTLTAATNQGGLELSQWWRVFHDPQLDTLIRQATLANFDLRLAQARVREARAQAGVARSALFPSADANGEYSRQRLSEHTPEGLLARGTGQSLEQNLFDTGFALCSRRGSRGLG